MQTLKLTAEFTQEGGGFTGWIIEIKGVIAHGDTLEEMKSELLKLLQIKFEAERDRNLKSADGTKEETEFNFAITA